MRKLFPDEEQTQDLFNRDDDRATKQDIQDLSTQIASTNQTLQNTINSLQSLVDSLSQSVNTNEINALNASINMLEAASANLQSANIFNLTVEELATFKQLTTDLATVAQDLTVGGDASITGDVSAKDATFDNLIATSATIANWTIDNLTTNTIEAEEIETDAVNATNATLTNINSDSITADTANVEDATINEANITEATVGLAKIDEVAIENIHWKDYQVYTADASKLYMVLPHFENGIYFLRARDGNQNTLFTVEVHNSIDNLFARWSQKEMNWVYKISKVGTGPNTQCMLEIHNIDNVAFNLEYATTCATPNVPAPTTYTEQPFPGNPMYKVSHQDGNKFFQNVDLANEGTTGAGLTMYATSNWALATTYYNYDGTMGVMSYNYLPNQSLNKENNVEFYGLQVHNFSTENLNVPGILKAKHIYDGPALSAEEKAALPDDTLLIEESQSSISIPNAYALSKVTEPSTMSDFIQPDNSATWKWSSSFIGCSDGGDFETLYPGSTIDYFPTFTNPPEELKATVTVGVETVAHVRSSFLVKHMTYDLSFLIYVAEPEVPSAGVVATVCGQEIHVASLEHFIRSDGTFREINDSDLLGYGFICNITTDGVDGQILDMNDEPMSVAMFKGLHVGNTFKAIIGGEEVECIILQEQAYALHTTELTRSMGSGAPKLNRKTTKNNTVQIKPLVPFNDDADPITDARPLVYDRTSDTIKKATGDLVLPNDVDIGGDLEVEGNITGYNATLDNIHAEDMILRGDLEVENDAMFRHDVSISGDLYVDGVEHINDSETTQSSGDYMILRHNNPIPLGSGEKSGIAVHNYKAGGTATLSVDSEGTWRLADNTATSVMHTNLYYYGGKYYDTSFVEQTFVDQIKTAFDEDEIDDCVFYNDDSFYHFDGTHWYAVSLVDNKLVTDETEVTDAALITALNALTKGPLQYFRKLEITTINEIENEAIFTRDEEANMADKALVQWDAATSKAKTIPLPTMNNQALTAQVNAAEPGFDERLLHIEDAGSPAWHDYFPSWPASPYSGTIPADATITYESIESGGYDSWYITPDHTKLVLNSQFEVTSIVYNSTTGKWDATLIPWAGGEEIWDATVSARHYYKEAVPASTTYQWKSNVGGGGLSFVGTRAQYNAAKLIPEGQDGYIGPNTLVTITDEDSYLEGDER